MRSCLALSFALIAMPFTTAGAADPALPGVRVVMEQALADHEVAGAVTLVATPEAVVHCDAAGLADIAANRPMTPDAIFWIASMSKPVTAAAVLILQDEGKLSIDDPVARHLPEFASLKTADGQPAPITLRHCLTHTAGMAEISAEEAAACTTLAQATALYAARPTAFPPGAKWQYCQSSINTAARVVEVVSGQPFPDFLRDRIFNPLGMPDTTFYLTEAQLPRLATSYARSDSGTLEPAANFILYGRPPTSTDRFPAANGGLFSTAADYARFARMLLNNGSLDGKQVLSPDAVSLMSTVQTSELVTGFTPGNGWGIGCCVVRTPQGPSAALSPGSFGHGGAFGTQAWIDPVKQRAYILMVQRSNFPNADASSLRAAFQQAAAQALDAPASRSAAPVHLFNGVSLDDWKAVDYLKAGPVTVADGTLRLEKGAPMTGVVSTFPALPRNGYELAYEANRLDGNDFFAAATFPVGKSCATFVNGGWGNTVSGISRLDGADASENDSSAFFPYKNGTWYRFRVRVTPDTIACWVDDKRVVHVRHADRQVDTRLESRRCEPLGFATYNSTGALRHITLRPLTPAEITNTDKDDD